MKMKTKTKKKKMTNLFPKTLFCVIIPLGPIIIAPPTPPTAIAPSPSCWCGTVGLPGYSGGNGGDGEFGSGGGGSGAIDGGSGRLGGDGGNGIVFITAF